MLSIVNHPWRVPPAPFFKYFVFILNIIIRQFVASRVQSRFLSHFPYRSLHKGFTLVLAAGDRLPIPGMIGPLQQ